jgi:SOS-response transcriptional repressor LexA
MNHTMSDQDKFERISRAERLKMARIDAGFKGVKSASSAHKWSVNNYKAHESGRNGFTVSQAKIYAKAFKVSLQWLYFGLGLPTDTDPVTTVDVPLVSWVSAGALTEQDGLSSFSDLPVVTTIDLPEGDWIALHVEGNSMNKISPPGSTIFVNRRDKRLVPNACYVVCDENGNATYKRYRPNDTPPFQPASYDQVEPPAFQGSISVVGRVRRSTINL